MNRDSRQTVIAALLPDPELRALYQQSAEFHSAVITVADVMLSLTQTFAAMAVVAQASRERLTRDAEIGDGIPIAVLLTREQAHKLSLDQRTPGHVDYG